MAPRIDKSALRSHGAREQVDRVWGRLESNLALGAEKSAPPSRRWQLFVAAAAIAGAATGFVISGAIHDSPEQELRVNPEPPDSTPEQIFASDTEAHVYPLPGGGFIRLEPESIVSVVAQGGQGLTLRLVRGEATLHTRSTTYGARTTRLALQVGRAELATAGDSSMRVRLDGDSAELEVIRGSATLTAPDDEVQHRVVTPRSRPYRVRVAEVTSAREPTAVVRSPLEPEADEDVAVEPETTPPPPPELAPVQPAWAEACKNFEYKKAAELIEREPGGANAALSSGLSDEQLSCIADGYEFNHNTQKAIDIQKHMRANSSPGYQRAAVANLARLYKASGDKATAEIYEQLEDDLVSADRLCKRIKSAQQQANVQEVERQSKKYRRQFPDGDCIPDIDKLDAERAKAAKGQPVKTPPPPAKSDDAEDEEEEDTQGSSP
jgi:hypothetical protein